MTDEKDLYTCLKQAGIETKNHESDLYFPSTDITRAILAGFPVLKSNSEAFTSNIDNQPWIDVPFAFSPYWDNIQVQIDKRKAGAQCD
jgi:hypothetical protein